MSAAPVLLSVGRANAGALLSRSPAALMPGLGPMRCAPPMITMHAPEQQAAPCLQAAGVADNHNRSSLDAHAQCEACPASQRQALRTATTVLGI